MGVMRKTEPLAGERGDEKWRLKESYRVLEDGRERMAVMVGLRRSEEERKGTTVGKEVLRKDLGGSDQVFHWE